VSTFHSGSPKVVARGPHWWLLIVSFVVHRMHSSCAYGSSCALSFEVWMTPSPFLSTQSTSLAAILVMLPRSRLETTMKRPSRLTLVREGDAAPLCTGSV
jgi:hypothetical protein